MNHDYRGAIYRSFDLFPLPAGDPAYVECVAVRGDRDVVQELGDTIDFAETGSFTFQLYTGARGAGKSTELLRLQDQKRDLVVIVDNLDRVVPICGADGRTKH